MLRLRESLVIAVFALAFQTPFLAGLFWLIYGPEISSTHWGLAVFLELAGTLAAFIAAWIMLAHSPLERYSEGLRLGLWTAIGFYLMWIVLFGVIPAIAGLEQGRVVDSALYFAEAIWLVLLASRGVPILVGALGGLLYVALKRWRLALAP